jgi:hypothetical protein
MAAHTKELVIRTLDYGVLPIAKDTTYISDECLGIIEMCDGKFYEVRRAFSGGLVGVEALAALK